MLPAMMGELTEAGRTCGNVIDVPVGIGKREAHLYDCFKSVVSGTPKPLWVGKVRLGSLDG